jgi:hypothetical protein
MASYLSTQVNPHVTLIGLSMGDVSETFSVTFSANTFVLGDTVTLAYIPIFSCIVDFFMCVTATLGSTITWNIGTTTTAAAYASASTFGQGAAVAGSYANGLNGFVTNSLPTARFTTQTVASIPVGLTLNPTSTVADYLVMTAAAAGGAATSATIKGYVRYHLNTVS